ncbi:MAG: MFS transporter [bacterium]|nr:MFS transporter [bacterium]
MGTAENSRNVYWIVIIAALGYFVDIYDLILYNVVKAKSLESIGITGQAFKDSEHILFNWQMFGMMLGGLIWGILGDKKGRISVLFGSILMYSVANIANGLVQNMPQYIICRFIAGIGLAGELGAGITLVSETLHKDKRGIGTMIIVSFGALGAVVASKVGGQFEWQTSYFIGGGLGLALLALRAGALESGMYKSVKASTNIKRGNISMLFKKSGTTFKYINCILIGVPIWFMIAVLINLSPDFVILTDGFPKDKMVGQAVMYAYIGLSAGDLLSGVLSQVLKSRRKVILIYIGISAVVIIYYLNTSEMEISHFRWVCFLLGFGTGYWALFVQVASESFGTNIRSTVTNTAPNFVRGLVVPITISYKYLANSMNHQMAAFVVGGVCLSISLLAVYFTKETFSKDLDYHEID